MNIILIGMPGSGKTTIAKALSEVTSMNYLSTDRMIERRTKHTIPEIVRMNGIEDFRKIEALNIKITIPTLKDHIIDTGGGSILNSETRKIFKENGMVLWIYRDLEKLDLEGRSFMRNKSVEQLFKERVNIYSSMAEDIIFNNGVVRDAVNSIIEKMKMA